MAKEKRATSELNIALAGIEAFFAVAESGCQMDKPTMTIDTLSVMRTRAYVETAREQLTVISSHLAKL